MGKKYDIIKKGIGKREIMMLSNKCYKGIRYRREGYGKQNNTQASGDRRNQ